MTPATVTADPPSASFVLMRCADLLDADQPHAAFAIRSTAGALGADLADWRDVPPAEAQAACRLLAEHALPVVEDQAGDGNDAMRLGRLLALGVIVAAGLRAADNLDDPSPMRVLAVLGGAMAAARFPVAIPAYILTMAQGVEPDLHALDRAGAKRLAGVLLACVHAAERLAVRADNRHGLRSAVGILSKQVADLLAYHRHGVDTATEAV